MPRTPAERVDLSFTLRLPPDDMKFLEQRRKELAANANAEALRDVIRNLRTCFGLPAFMVDRLERDRKEGGGRGHNSKYTGGHIYDLSAPRVMAVDVANIIIAADLSTYFKGMFMAH